MDKKIGKEQVLANWNLINRLAKRRFGDSVLAEESALFVMEQLLANECDRISGYHGRGDVSAFLAAVSHRLLEDFSRQRFGRKRPPLWIRNLGGIWLKLYRLLCFERMKIEDAVETISQVEYSEQSVDDVAWEIRQRVVDCGKHQGLDVELEDHELSLQDCENSPVSYEEREKRELFKTLFELFTKGPEELVERNVNRFSKLRIQLSPEEKVLLKLSFQDGLSVTKAGEMLGLNRDQVHGRVRRLLSRIRQDFEQTGLEKEIRVLLQ